MPGLQVFWGFSLLNMQCKLLVFILLMHGRRYLLKIQNFSCQLPRCEPVCHLVVFVKNAGFSRTLSSIAASHSLPAALKLCFKYKLLSVLTQETEG